MKEKMEVYETIRNEIISIQELQRNVWIYMYVLFGTLFVLGLEWSNYLFLVSYVILMPFQCIINDYQWSISKMSTYIRLFFEEEDKEIGWESLHIYPGYKEYYRNKTKSIRGIIRISGAVHLGFLSTFFYCWNILQKSYINGAFAIGIVDLIWIVISIILFLILILVNKDFYHDYDDELDDVIRKYKKERTNQ